jgi:cardiolipin synthase
MSLDLGTILEAAAAFFGFVGFAFIPLVLLRKKEAPSAIAWILVLIFLPLVGVVLFWFLGRDRVRRPAREKRSTNVAVRGRLASLPGIVRPVDSEPDLSGQPPEQRGVMRLAAKVGRMDIVGGNKIEVLVGAPDTYDQHIEAIERARDHVHLEIFIFRPDQTGQRFIRALVAAAERGVKVRVLYDAFGSRGLGAAMRELRRAGGYTAKWFPIDPVRRAWMINLRNHRKLMIVDGAVGFTGGVNIGDMFLPWRDVHLRIEGPAVSQLQTIFVEDWFFVTRHDLVAPEFFPSLPGGGTSVMQIVESGPDATVESIHRLYFAAIASARDRVYITTPYFVPDRALLVALQTAALRGVEVRLILPRRSNHRVTFHAGRSYYDELLEAGVTIHEYVPGMVHAKTMVVDGRLATVGSANLDVRSFRLNFELIAVIYDAEVVGRLERIFMEDLGSTEIVDLGQWRQRSVVTKVKEGIGRLCAPLL